MSNRKTEATATHLEDALASTLAAVLACDERDVQVRIEAPRLDGFAGQWHVALSFDGADAVGPERAPRDAQEPEVVPPAGDADHDRDDHGEADDVPDTDDPRDAEGGAEAGADDLVDRPEDATSAEDVEDAGAPRDDGDTLEEEAEAGADFVEGLLDALDLPGDLRIKYGEDHAEIEVVDVGSGALIGRRGQTLESIQELLRCSLQREFQRRARVKVDVEGYRARRLEKLLEKADEAIDAVLDTGEPERLEPMDVFERKAVHHRVAEVDGLISRSQGREPARRVIIERG